MRHVKAARSWPPIARRGSIALMLIRPFDDTDPTADRRAVIALWRRCDLLRPWNDPNRDIDRKLAMGDELFLVGEQEDELIAAVMVGYDGHRGWVNYLAVDPSRQGQGIGRRLMHEAERRLEALGCPKLNLQVRDGNETVLAFYRSLGYRMDATVSLGKRLIPDA